ncbi:hypothetical protein TWF506_003278 [Arthrobotrys conoides]|uniref:Uncharacterized protein n=1 Tax=Arthrobotrys conoides TaxID=74498 RepID=A0AAN8NHW9_9PEZI
MDCSAFLSVFIGGGGEEEEPRTTFTIISSTTITLTETVTLPTTTTDDFLSTQTTITGIPETTTITLALPMPDTLKKRQGILTIPEYASPCAGPMRFSSACACIGVASVPIETITDTTTVETIITIPTVATVYTTATETATSITITTTAPQKVIETVYRFRVRTFDGTNTIYLEGLPYSLVGFTQDQSAATYFEMNSANGRVYLVDDREQMIQVLGEGSTPREVLIDDYDTSFQRTPLQCEIKQPGNKLECKLGNSSVFGKQGQFLRFGPVGMSVDAPLELTAIV